MTSLYLEQLVSQKHLLKLSGTQHCIHKVRDYLIFYIRHKIYPPV